MRILYMFSLYMKMDIPDKKCGENTPSPVEEGKRIGDFDVDIDPALPDYVKDVILPPHLAKDLEAIIKMVRPLGLKPIFSNPDDPKKD